MYAAIPSIAATGWGVIFMLLINVYLSVKPLAVPLVIMLAATRMKHSCFLVFYQGLCAVEGLLNCFSRENGAIESTCKSFGCIIKYLNLAMYSNHAREASI